MISWSHSKLKNYETCPYRIVLSQKHKQTSNKYTERGINDHKVLEDYLNNITNTLDIPFFKEDMQTLKNAGAVAEQRIGITKEWKLTSWKEAWGRCILDAVLQNGTASISIIDYKTGKPSPISHQDQSQTNALIARVQYPGFKEYNTEFWYLDTGKKVIQTYDNKNLDRCQAVLTARIARLENDTMMRPKPNKYVCAWCAYKEPCEYEAT